MEDVRKQLHSFFRSPPADCGMIASERALQLELGLFLRTRNMAVDFERSLKADRLPSSTLKKKHNLDLLVSSAGQRAGIELKVPLNGQHPETIYAFFADIEFLEAIKRAGMIDDGFAIMMTPDRAFWTDSGRGSPIHNLFRQPGSSVTGLIGKPTGARDSAVMIEGCYTVSGSWQDCGLLPHARFLLVEI
ncbi:MAG: hypothetical protein A2885_18935 [Sphingopyxis sp. RIFCSPHIGHO2_01_FULL_65_24]|nr:MAG: hypothetical protein A2885_18935 [Sphingopyxis sp. RIFCSPHIGHO2_01_FULL_65_24]